MKKIINNVIYVLLMLFVLSCGISNKLNRTTNKREKIINQLFENNGNAFYISSSHVLVSYVWSYSDNKINIYKLSGNKIWKINNLPINERDDFFKQLSKEELYEIDKCMELDGDIFGYKFKKDGLLERHDFPVNIDCFVQQKFKSKFLNKIITDINTYQIKW